MRVVDVKDVPGLVGQELGTSDWFTVDQTLIDRFADLTDDHQWIHVDVDRADKEIGGTIAHGFLTLSMMSTMMQSVIRITGYKRSINYGCNKLRFTGAVPSGARIRLRAKLLSIDKKPDRMILLRECNIEVEGQERPAMYAEWLTLLFV
jgi:acyl dehydratase